MSDTEDEMINEIDAVDEVEVTMRRKKDIVDNVANTTGLKKRDVREALDAAFTYIHASLSDGKDIAYPTLGKIKVHVQRPDTENPKTIYRVSLSKMHDDVDSDETALEPNDEDA